MSKFTTGKVVMLKSGGFPMTVTEPDHPIGAASKIVHVMWHARDGLIFRDLISEDNLVLAERSYDEKEPWQLPRSF